MTEPFSVLYLNPTQQPRAGIATLSRGLADTVDVRVLAPGESEPRFDQRPDVTYEYFDARYVPEVRYTLPTPSFWRSLRRQIAAVDLVHAYSYFYPVCTLASLASVRSGTPFVLTVDSVPGVNWSSGSRPVDLIARTYTETLGRMTFAAADRTVALGEYLVGPLSGYTDGDSRLVIPNGIDTDRFSPSETERRGDGDSIDLLYVGRLDPVKGIEHLLEAVSSLGDGYRLTLVGDGTRRPAYERLCSDLGIADRTTFEGFRSDVVPYYRSHDLFVLPSLSEGQPTVLMEAQACGLPVISTDVGAASTLVETGETVPAGDSSRLADAIRSFDVDGDASRRARAHIVDRYSEGRMCRDYLELYRRLVSG